MRKLRAIVKGRVQGVGFRYFVIRNAAALGLSGYARNLANGDVEVVAEGERTKLEELLEALKRGPSFSMVSVVNAEWSDAAGAEFSGFTIKY